MLWIYLVILQILFFVGLLFFLRFVLTRNITNATSRLQALSKEYVAKEEEANKILQNAQKEAKAIVAKETQAGQDAKEKLIKEAQEQKEHIIHEANQKSEEMAEKAQRNADFIRKELEQRIDDRAKERLGKLIERVIPEDFLKEVHQKWVNDAHKSDFNLKNIKFPEKVKEAKVVCAFPLTDKEMGDLKEKLKKKVGNGIVLKSEVDRSLISGFIISVGSVVVDASLKNRIQKAMQEK